MAELSTENEAWYDAEIAPALADLAKRCDARGMSFVAVVEYAPGHRGATYFIEADAGLEMHMLYMCSQTAPNVDAYVINLCRHCRRNGIDASSSIAMQRFAPSDRGGA